ncbi:serpentine receptor, class R [Listeria monocytogenes]|nr:serpentine receptor, class R [Listeria monocytogenes]EGS3165093.1 serpentine receptor, class R [Listeria monocytogenes]EGS4849500.1 serpentine receptor, class R [Listeria monocytogenes]
MPIEYQNLRKEHQNHFNTLLEENKKDKALQDKQLINELVRRLNELNTLMENYLFDDMKEG